MILFPNGIYITHEENLCLLHVETNPQAWLLAAIQHLAEVYQEKLINQWLPRLRADPDVGPVPANDQAIVDLIMVHPTYRTRFQADAEASEPPYHYNVDRFEGIVPLFGRGPHRIPGNATVILFPNGISISDLGCNCILAYVRYLDDCILGALLGWINRGKKKMIRQYQPVLIADPSVATIPADEAELIGVITARDDYETIPQQIQRVKSAQQAV